MVLHNPLRVKKWKLLRKFSKFFLLRIDDVTFFHHTASLNLLPDRNYNFGFYTLMTGRHG